MQPGLLLPAMLKNKNKTKKNTPKQKLTFTILKMLCSTNLTVLFNSYANKTNLVSQDFVNVPAGVKLELQKIYIGIGKTL